MLYFLTSKALIEENQGSFRIVFVSTVLNEPVKLNELKLESISRQLLGETYWTKTSWIIYDKPVDEGKNLNFNLKIIYDLFVNSAPTSWKLERLFLKVELRYDIIWITSVELL